MLWNSRSLASPPRRFRRTVVGGLSDELGREPALSVTRRADEDYPSLARRIPTTRLGARDLLRTSAYTIAVHRQLVERGVAPQAATAVMSDIVFASIISPRTALHRLSRLRHRDPVKRAEWGSKVARRLYYTSPGWVMHDVDVDSGFGFDVTQCAVAEFYESLGMTELCQKAICDQDVRSAEYHGISLTRHQTLASGGTRCDFRYDLPVREAGAVSGPMAGVAATSESSPDRSALVDTVEINAPPGNLWVWLADLAVHYTEWHPDHVSAEWIKGEPNQVGSQLKAVEQLTGHREELVFEMVDVDPPRRMEYRILGPHGLLLPSGSFEISEGDGGSVFRASINYRFGRLTRSLFRSRMEAMRVHMREEGEQLRRIIEAS